MELPILPQEFSRQARKRIIDSEIMASRALKASEPHLRSFYVSSRSSGNWQVLEQYVLPVFLAFAKETCAMSQHKPKPWYSDQIDRVVREFLRELLVAVRGEYDRPDYPVFAMTSDVGGYGYVRPEAKDIIEKSAEWKTYQDLLLTVEDASEQPESETEPSMQTGKRIGYRKEVYAWMERQGIDNVEIAARRLGISKSALKSVMSDKGKARYGPELLERVLKLIGSQSGGE